MLLSGQWIHWLRGTLCGLARKILCIIFKVKNVIQNLRGAVIYRSKMHATLRFRSLWWLTWASMLGHGAYEIDGKETR